MVRKEEAIQSPDNQKDPPKQSNTIENGANTENLFSPRFKSVAAMAGWDEEALLIASLVVEDTPDREFKHKKRSDLQLKTPPTNSRRKRRAQRRSPNSIPVAVLDLDEEEPAREESEKKKTESKTPVKEENKVAEDEFPGQNSGVSCSSLPLPCMDKLRDELSCAICLEICFEPSTTPCGHSFCKKCLRSAADKCGKKCPKCRQLISNGRSCTVNTVLWNTIQLLFPQEIAVRKATGELNSREAKRQSPGRGRCHSNVRNRSIRPSGASSSRDAGVRRRRSGVVSQDEDAALALRLQREEFMEDFRGTTHDQSGTSLSLARVNLRAMATHGQSGPSLSLARANLRALATRAMSLRSRGGGPV